MAVAGRRDVWGGLAAHKGVAVAACASACSSCWSSLRSGSEGPPSEAVGLTGGRGAGCWGAALYAGSWFCCLCFRVVVLARCTEDFELICLVKAHPHLGLHADGHGMGANPPALGLHADRHHHHHHHQKAFRNKSHTSHGHRPGLKRNKSKGKRLTINYADRHTGW